MNDDYYEYTYINDGGGNVNGIKFTHINNPNPLTNTFKIEVGRHYSLYDIGGVIKKPMHNIVVVRIDDRNIYYKVFKTFTDDISRSHLGEAEHFMPVTNISGTNTTKRLFQLSLHPGVNIHEGGRNKRGRKSKKYSKTKSKSRTRRGGRRSRRVRHRVKRKSRR